jgi:SAM-dependent methyltransferase
LDGEQQKRARTAALFHMYELLARYYDIIHSSLTADREYILGLARNAGGPILELGCGTGRLLLPLARAGYAVTGVDSSPAMLARARMRLEQEQLNVQQAVVLVEADIKRLSLPREERNFSLILLPYNTLLHFQSDEIRQLLRSVSRYLDPTGRLFIDVVNPFIVDAVSNDPEPALEREYIDQETGETIRQLSHSWLASTEQCLHTTWIFEIETGNERDTKRTTIDFDYWYQYPHQLELILQQSGYRVERMMGDYDESPFDEKSDRLLITATLSAVLT